MIDVVYDDALASGWESWSWSSVVDFSATDLVYAGSTSIRAELQSFGAVSLHNSAGFGGMGGVRFYVEGDAPALSLMLEADGEGYASEPVFLSDSVSVAAGRWTEVEVDLSAFGDHAWTRIEFFNNGFDEATIHLDDITLLTSAPEADPVVAIEPIGPQTLLVVGSADASSAVITLNGAGVGVAQVTTATDPDRSYISLDMPLSAGTLTVQVGDTTVTRTLQAASASVGDTVSHTISPWIYGMAFAPDATYIADHGVTVVRWGGNATSLYNPYGPFTNLAFDWYFENTDATDAAAWLDMVTDAGALPFFSVPALDYVAADNSACAYSVARYGSQQETDPWEPDCGNGIAADGTPITWNDPTDAGTAWTSADAGAWLGSLAAPPPFAAVDNELDIASSTHQDVHPEPVTYDELRDRWLDYARAIKGASPSTLVFGPSSCCYWFYWNSAAGDEDKAAHGGEDLLPWWLGEIAAADAAAGQRTLDYFDLHFYPNDVFSDDTSDDIRAERLRSTRGLWDPDYTDEGWIGVDGIWATDTQPDPTRVQLLPRFRAIVDAAYPGTGLALTEWNWGAEFDLSGGLAVADVLGILGREGVDLATYWTAPEAGTPAAEAFRLYRAGATPFGGEALPVVFDNPDLLGVYAALDGDRQTIIVINKDPAQDVLLDVSGLAAAVGDVVHFSAGTDGALIDDGSVALGPLVVPAYGAVRFSLGGEPDSEPDSDSDDSAPTPDTADTASAADQGKTADGCGCAVGHGRGGGLLLLLGLGLIRRARS